MTVYELEKVADEEIERLIECEYKGETYQRAVLVVDPELQSKFLQAEEYLAQVETAKAIREQMLSLFEKQGIKSWESPSGKIKVTYVEPTDRVGVDSAKLKKEYPQVFSDCQKLTKVKSQIRVKVRGDEDDE